MKRLVLLAAFTSAATVSFATNFLWKNYNSSAYFNWADASSWYVGTDYVTDFADADRVPGEDDTIGYSVRENGGYAKNSKLSANLGGETVTIKGFDFPHTSWKTVDMKFTNGTLRVTDAYGAQYPHMFFEHANFVAPAGSGTTSHLGASGVNQEFWFKYGSSGTFEGHYDVYSARIYVDDTSSLVFNPTRFCWSNPQTTTSVIDNKGTASFPSGIVMGFLSAQNGVRHFDVTNAVGAVMNIGGDVATKDFPAPTDAKSQFLDFYVMGGTVNFDASPTFDGVGCHFSDNSEVALNVTAGNVLDLTSFVGGNGTAIVKGGAGAVRVPSEAAYTLDVTEGAFCVTDAATPIPSFVTLTSGRVLLETGSISAEKLAATSGPIVVDLTKIRDGEPILTSDDASLLASYLARLTKVAGVIFQIENGAIYARPRLSPIVSTWTGAAGDGKWTTIGNWSGDDVPGVFTNDVGIVTGSFGDTALFPTTGSASQTVDLAGLIIISNVTVSGSTAYTFGTSGTQSLRLIQGGRLTVADDVTRDVTLAARLSLGWEVGAVARQFYLENDSTQATLRVNDLGYLHGSSSWKAQQLWLEGVGDIRFLVDAPHTMGGHALALYNCVKYDADAGTGKVYVDKKLTLHSVVSYDRGMKNDWRCYDIAGDLNFSSGGTTTAEFGADRKVLFTGSGKVTFVSTAGKGYDTSANVANTAVFDCELASSGGTKGILFTNNGDHYLNGVNSMEGTVALMSGGSLYVSTIGTVGGQSALGLNDAFVLAWGARLRYTGAGETATKYLLMSNSVARIIHNGTGDLTMDSSPVTVTTGTTLSLRNESACAATWAGVLKDNPYPFGLLLDGGTWSLTGANTFTGATTLESGTLRLAGDGTLATSSEVVLKAGTALVFDGCGAEALQKLTVADGATSIRLSGTTLALAALARTDSATLNIETDGESVVSVAGMTSASDPCEWLTINGRAAGFDDDGKIVKRLIRVDTAIAAKGGVIPNDATKNVGITTVGDGDHVTLANGESAAVAVLVQATTVKAEVEIPEGKTLTAGGLYAEEGAAALQVGGFAKDGTLVAAGDSLVLYPEGRENDLTVMTPVSIPTATVVTKEGDGTARFADPAFGSWTGTIQINRGTFAVSNATGVAATLSGTGAFAVEATGSMTLTKGQTPFKGDFAVVAGEVRPAAGTVFGSTDGSDGRTTVAAGARIDLTAASSADINFGKRPFVVAGDGGDGAGALRTSVSRNATTGPISLSADATVATPDGKYLHQRGSGIADYGGHTLTKVGNGFLTFQDITVTNAGEIVIDDVAGASKTGLVLYRNTDLGDSDKPITLGNGSVVYLGTAFNPGSKPYRRPLTISGTNVALNTWATGLYTNENVWAGPITFANADAQLWTNPWNNHNDAIVGIFGKISGPGSLRLYNHGKTLIGNPANDFTGTVRVEGANNNSATFLYPGSLPDPARLTVDMSRATVVTEGESGGFWKKADILAAVNAATFTTSVADMPSGVLAIDARTAPGSEYELSVAQSDIGDGSNFAIGADGGRVALTGDFTKGRALAAFSGTLVVSGGTTRTVESVMASSDGSNDCGVVSFEGGSKTLVSGGVYAGMPNWGHLYSGRIRVANATLEAETLPASGSVASINLGLRQHTGVLDVEAGAQVKAGLRVGADSTGSRGAVYVRGGSLTAWSTTGQSTLFASGPRSYGFLGLEDGSYVQHGFAALNAGGNDTYESQGLVYQSGGTFHHDKFGESAASFMWRIGGSRDSVTTVYRTGGTMKVDGQIYLVNQTTAFTNNFVQWTQGAGCGRAECDMQCILAANNDAHVVLNLNGGTLSATHIYKYRATDNSVHVNFDGGEVEVKSATTAVFGPVAKESGEAVDRVTVFGGGAKIAVAPNCTATLDTALQAPEGNGVTAVPLPAFKTDDGQRLVGPPTIRIVDEGGAGYGATAVVGFNRATGSPEGVVITSPGCNYTNPKAYFRYGTNVWTSVCSVGAAAATGGFTKTGEGTLVLNAANTYGGATTVEDGVLKIGSADAIPSGSQLILRGGMLDPNEIDVDLANAVFAGGGVKGDVTLPTALSVDFDRALVGKPMRIDGVATVVPGTVLTVNGFDASKLEPGKKVTLLETEGTVGAEYLDVAGIDVLPSGCTLEVFEDGKKVRLNYRKGLILMVR